jgi:hypothetical protein
LGVRSAKGLNWRALSLKLDSLKLSETAFSRGASISKADPCGMTNK